MTYPAGNRRFVSDIVKGLNARATSFKKAVGSARQYDAPERPSDKKKSQPTVQIPGSFLQ